MGIKLLQCSAFEVEGVRLLGVRLLHWCFMGLNIVNLGR